MWPGRGACRQLAGMGLSEDIFEYVNEFFRCCASNTINNAYLGEKHASE